MSNLVPEGWSLRNLGSTLDVLIAGQSPNRKEFPARPSEYGILKTTAIDWGRFYPQHNQEVLDDFKPNLKHEVAVDDILITKAGPVHRVGVVAHVKSTPSKILVSGKMTLMRVKQDYVSSFIAYALSTEYSQKPLKESTTGMASSQTNFTHDTLKEIPIVVPDSKNEQKKIAAILTSVDEVIEKTQAQIDKLKDLKTGMMQELLTRGVGVDGKPHTEFKEIPKWTTGRIADLKEIPSSWELVNINDVAKLESGHTPSRDKPEYWGGSFQWVSLHDTKQLHTPIINKTKLTITQSGLDNSSARLLPIGTIAFSRTASVGHCVMFGEKMATSQDFANYVCGDKLSPRYVLQLFRWMQHVWSQLAEGSTHKTIYMPVFKKLHILLPPLNEQVLIADIAESIDKKILMISDKLEANKKLKKALMQDLLTGKVRVKVDS